MEPAAFERQIRWLAAHGYHAIAPSEWLEWCRKRTALPEKPIVITFDDGYSDVAEHALPVLERQHFRAGVYVVTGQFQGTNRWDIAHGSEAHRLMSKEQIRYWADRGIEFGSHTRSHNSLTGIDEARLLEEVAGSGEDLRQTIGHFPGSFAYPYGAYSRTVRECVNEYFSLAFTCDEGLNDIDTDLLLLRRTMIQPRDSIVDLICRLRLGHSPLERVRGIIKLRTRARWLAAAPRRVRTVL